MEMRKLGVAIIIKDLRLEGQVTLPSGNPIPNMWGHLQIKGYYVSRLQDKE